MLKSSVLLTLVILLTIFAYGCFDEPTSPANQLRQFSRAEVSLKFTNVVVETQNARMNEDTTYISYDSTFSYEYQFVNIPSNPTFCKLLFSGDTVSVINQGYYWGNYGTQLIFILDYKNNKLKKLAFNTYIAINDSWGHFVDWFGFVISEMDIIHSDENYVEAYIQDDKISWIDNPYFKTDHSKPYYHKTGGKGSYGLSVNFTSISDNRTGSYIRIKLFK